EALRARTQPEGRWCHTGHPTSTDEQRAGLAGPVRVAVAGRQAGVSQAAAARAPSVRGRGGRAELSRRLDWTVHQLRKGPSNPESLTGPMDCLSDRFGLLTCPFL